MPMRSAFRGRFEVAEFRELYSYPEAYDIVFDRPIEREIEFISSLFRKINKKEMSSFLEIACGPAYHARAFATRGIQSVGFDLEESMVRFAKARASSENISLDVFCADMRDFISPIKVDVVAAMLDGIDSLLSTDELIEHLKCVAASLNDDGLYIVDNMHPRDVNPWSYEPVIYTGTKDQTTVTITYGVTPPEIDAIMQTARSKTEIKVVRGDSETITFSEAVERFMTVQEMILLARCAGCLKFVGAWGDFKVNTKFGADDNSTRMIIVLQKTA
jgi:cyclopropane fatty-acyl-phospholipid synthase-like methyltransferase